MAFERMVFERVEFVKPDTKDYPMEMYLVPNREKYNLLKVGDALFVPLYQVFDAMAGFRPNEEWRNGVRYCPNCRREWRDDGSEDRED